MRPSSPLTGTVHVDAGQVLARALAVGLLACALIGLPFLLHFRGEVAEAQERAAAGERHSVEVVSRLMTQTLQSVVSDLRYLSDQNELRELLADDTAARRTRLAQEYSAFLTQKPRYDQVRWIGADGWERVRVHRVGGRVATVPVDQLQNKADRYYFGESMRLARTQIYVSALDLNVEGGRLEEPPKPTLRVALPLFHPDGRKAGILIANYLAGPLLAEMRGLLPPARSTLWLLNADGYWLLGPDREAEWAFMYPDRADRSLAVREPAAWKQLVETAGGHLDLADGLLTFGRVYPLLADDQSVSQAGLPIPASAADPHWTLATHLPRALLDAEADEVARHLLVAYAALALLAFTAASGLAYLSFRNRAVGHFIQHVLDHVPALIAYVDATERYRYNNRHYETLFGVSPGVLAGRPVRAVLGEAAYRVVLPHIRAVLAGEQVSFEAPITYARAGRRDVTVTYVPDTAADGRVRGFVAVVNDVTPLKTAERRERERLREAAHATRLASVGELATQIAHEVNQPVTAMINYCAAAERNVQAECPANARLLGLVGAIAAEAGRVSTIIRRLRDFVRKGEIAFVAADLNEIVAGALQLVAADAAAQQVEIVEQLADGPLRVRADSVLLSQATLNLLRNAVDAVTADGASHRRVTVATRRTGSMVEVSVTDEGPGLAPEVATHLFEAFVTTKRNGLGMGLSIARTILEAHGGQIRYSPAAGGGCTFTLTLPGVDT